MSTPAVDQLRAHVVAVGDDEVRLLRDGTAAHAAMLEAIRGARREVLLEMYWIGDDHVGRAFRDAMTERARAGVDVRVIYDDVGSFGLPAGFWGPLVAAGGQARVFSPISPWEADFRVLRLHRRDHRKNLIVDLTVGYAGGINLGAVWAPLHGEAWRDDAIEVRGPSANDLRVAFYKVWSELGGTPPPGATDASARPGARVHVLTNEVRERPNRLIRRTYLFAIRAARSSICITNAYFLPGPRMLHALRRAAARGVRVRLLLPDRTDVPLVKLAAASVVGGLLDAGIEIYAFERGILHAKTAVFDDAVAIIGSHNLDAYSWRFNLECNVVVEDAAFATQVRRSFDEDCAASRRIDIRAWRRRPLWTSVVARAAALLRPIL